MDIFSKFLKSIGNDLILECISNNYSVLTESVSTVSLQAAKDGNMFGPLYHGTDEISRENIDSEGFKVFIGNNSEGNIKNGYTNKPYAATNVPPPIHHLGYGVYFTTNKNIAKRYNGDSSVGLKEYFIDSKNIGTINFGSGNTMMKWWIDNGYSPELASKDRVEATKNLTNTLKSKFDAVWYKGKGLYKLLDGDQICVYNLDTIKVLDSKLSNKGDIGSKVKRKTDGMIGIIKAKADAKEKVRNFPNAATWIRPDSNWVMSVTWKKGGTDMNVQDDQVDFI